MVCGDFDRGDLIIEQAIPKLIGNAELREACPSLLCKVIGDLDVNMIWRNRILACPAFFDYLNQLFGDINTPAIPPAVLEPCCELGCGVMVEDVDVLLTLI